MNTRVRPQIILFLFMFRPVLEEMLDTWGPDPFPHPPSPRMFGAQCIGNTSCEMGRCKKQKYAQVSGAPLVTFSISSIFSYFCHNIYTMFIYFPRAVDNSHVKTHSFNDHVRRQMTIPVCPFELALCGLARDKQFAYAISIYWSCSCKSLA